MNEWAIETDGLSKHFRHKDAVHDLSLRVPKGSVFGFLGKNGAGKTTTIKMLLGLLRPSKGTVRVLGMDMERAAVEIRRRVGYVSEDRPLYPWMTLEEILWFVKPSYPNWNDQKAEGYLERFRLDRRQKVGSFSKGMIGQVWLTIALSHEPDLLVLDEPTSGLDSTVRKDFLESIVDLASREGKTVFFSSHNLADVERVADYVGIMDEGRLVFTAEMDQVKSRIRQVAMTFDHEPPPIQGEAWIRVRQLGRHVELLTDRFDERMVDQLREQYRPRSVDPQHLTLEELFVSWFGGR